MPEASAAGITKVNVRQAATHPWKVMPTNTSGVAYTQAQIVAHLQIVIDRNNA